MKTPRLTRGHRRGRGVGILPVGISPATGAVWRALTTNDPLTAPRAGRWN
jgi:hypothetical protein